VVTGPEVTALDAAVYVIPTDAPEADGTLAWDKTTMVLVTARAGGEQGVGWSYTSRAAAAVVGELLEDTVDCLQLDVTRCGGVTEFLRGAGLAAAHSLQVSGHCAPNLHAHVAAAVPNLRHVEYFHDHQRIERMLFDGTLDPHGGTMCPDPGRPGHGMILRNTDAEQFRQA
jgi:L-alanine-DL-glutamate epimerase-like enolase superfamily enzyme